MTFDLGMLLAAASVSAWAGYFVGLWVGQRQSREPF